MLESPWSFGKVFGRSWKILGKFLEKSWKFLEKSWKSLGKVRLGKVFEKSWKDLRKVFEKLRKILGKFLEKFWKSPGKALEKSWKRREKMKVLTRGLGLNCFSVLFSIIMQKMYWAISFCHILGKKFDLYRVFSATIMQLLGSSIILGVKKEPWVLVKNCSFKRKEEKMAKKRKWIRISRPFHSINYLQTAEVDVHQVDKSATRWTYRVKIYFNATITSGSMWLFNWDSMNKHYTEPE